MYDQVVIERIVLAAGQALFRVDDKLSEWHREMVRIDKWLALEV